MLGIVLRYDQIRPPSLRDQMIEVSLQILGIVVLGAIVTYATDQLQQAAEARRRLDERVLEFLDAMVGVYNGVKQVRRSLQAEARGHEPGSLSIDRDTYVRLLTELSGHQVSFESLRDRATLLQDRVAGATTIRAEALERTTSTSIAPETATETAMETEAKWRPGLRRVKGFDGSMHAHLRMVEHHLNVLVSEYQDNLHRVHAASRFPLENLRNRTGSKAALTLFIDDDPFWFKCCVSRHIRAVRHCLESHLLRGKAG